MKLKINEKIVKGSFILLLAFGLFNFFNFMFQFFMARMLSVSEYGVLATLFAVIYILFIFSESVQMIIVKYSANENDEGKLKSLLKKSSKKAFLISIILFIFYLAASIPLSSILKIDYLLLSFNGLIIFLSFFLPLTRGIMQGRRRFKSFGFNIILESGIKLVLGIFFVYLGWKIYGAITALILGGSIAFFLSLISLKDVIKSEEKKAETEGIYNYAKPTFIISFIIIVFYSLDVVLAKIFFSPEIAGSYAIASILGKIILWGTLPISKAMFPISIENKKEGNKSGNVFINSLFILFLGIFFALIFFYFFPEFIIKIFSGKDIPGAISILFYLGIAFSLISLANLILLYKLSLGKVKGYLYLIIFIFIEIGLLSYFSKDLLQFSIAFITASAAFLWASIFLVE